MTGTPTPDDRPDRPRIVCISGSMRFEEQMRAAAVDESLAGAIVTGPFVNMKRPDPRWATDEQADPIKTALDSLHLAKIDLADEVLVVAPGGYIGDSTRAEIAYAERHGKPVRRWLEPDGQPAGEPTCICTTDCPEDPTENPCPVCRLLDPYEPCPVVGDGSEERAS